MQHSNLVTVEGRRFPDNDVTTVLCVTGIVHNTPAWYAGANEILRPARTCCIRGNPARGPDWQPDAATSTASHERPCLSSLLHKLPRCYAGDLWARQGHTT